MYAPISGEELCELIFVVRPQTMNIVFDRMLHSIEAVTIRQGNYQTEGSRPYSRVKKMTRVSHDSFLSNIE